MNLFLKLGTNLSNLAQNFDGHDQKIPLNRVKSLGQS